MRPSEPRRFGPGYTGKDQPLRANRRSRLLRALGKSNVTGKVPAGSSAKRDDSAARKSDAPPASSSNTAFSSSPFPSNKFASGAMVDGSGGGGGGGMLAFADRVTDGMFQLHPANVRQYDPAWMTDRLDEILDMVPSSAIAARNAAKSPAKKTRVQVSVPEQGEKWAEEPGSPRRNRLPKRGDGTSVQSVPTTHGEQLFQGCLDNEKVSNANDSQQTASNGNTIEQGQVATSKFAAEILSLCTGDDVIKFYGFL